MHQLFMNYALLQQQEDEEVQGRIFGFKTIEVLEGTDMTYQDWRIDISEPLAYE